MDRIDVLKTYKLYIAGKFPRTESGRYYQFEGSKKGIKVNICLSSRKDFRNAVVAARKAQDSWASRPAYNIGQVIYRIAENLEGAKSQFIELVQLEQGLNAEQSKQEVEKAIDRLVYFAGWSDKFQQIFSSVNPVSSSHFNFSVLEPCGVVAVLSDSKASFLTLVSAISSILVGGNTAVVLAGEYSPLTAISFAEIINNSDVPPGVINILTGKQDELKEHFAGHMDVNSLLYLGDSLPLNEELQQVAIQNLKRLNMWTLAEVSLEKFEEPYRIKSFLETKTTWHPIEQIGGSQAGY